MNLDDNEARCSICGCTHVSVHLDNTAWTVFAIDCAICGKYTITRIARSSQLPQYIIDTKHLFSGVIRKHSESGSYFYVDTTITSDEKAYQTKVLSEVPRGVRGKCDAILKHFVKQSRFPGDKIFIDPDVDYPIGFCTSDTELNYYLKHLEECGDIRTTTGRIEDDVELVLTPAGWDRLDGYTDGRDSDQCFTAMWFDPNLNVAYTDGIKKLESLTGYRMLRIDGVQFNDKICDRILAEIRKSRFMIADVTGHRHAVYFEAGFAMGLGIPVIWTCARSDLEKCPNFDTRQYNHIVWDTADDLRDKVLARIEATIGKFKL